MSIDHSAASHQQYSTNYSQYEPQPEVYANTDPYQNNNAHSASAPLSPPQAYSNATSYYSAAATTPAVQPQPDRSYTLGGDGYGMNTLPPLPGPTHSNPDSFYQADQRGSPGPINTSVPLSPVGRTSPVKGPRAHRTMSSQQYEDSPPGYDTEGGSGNIPGAWGKH